MVVNHLVSLSPLVDVPDVRRNLLDAAHEREDRLFKLLNAAVRDTDVVEDVGLVSELDLLKGFGFQGPFQCFDTLLVLFVSEVGQSHKVQDQSIVFIFNQS
jgi:hypothetical protein